MAWEPSETSKRFLMESNATYRIVHNTEVYGDPPVPGARPVIIKPATIRCQVIDKTTGRVHAEGFADGEKEALDAAVAVAEKTPAPLTPAQEAALARQQLGVAGAENVVLKTQAAAKDDQIALLTASMANMQAQIAALTAAAQKPADPAKTGEIGTNEVKPPKK